MQYSHVLSAGTQIESKEIFSEMLKLRPLMMNKCFKLCFHSTTISKGLSIPSLFFFGFLCGQFNHRSELRRGEGFVPTPKGSGSWTVRRPCFPGVEAMRQASPTPTNHSNLPLSPQKNCTEMFPNIQNVGPPQYSDKQSIQKDSLSKSITISMINWEKYGMQHRSKSSIICPISRNNNLATNHLSAVD